ncbi:MAG: ribonuclease H-like domain-containing protein, partial [Candidatus Levybacteria bacterium]|nr:ribonuclease H-like domain-containing protein [Candidatus Levybacteria bacterium]
KNVEDFIANTSFDGAFGRIVCLSYAINEEPIKTLCSDEKKILQDFWEVAKEIDLFIGFNLMDFDLRFIYQRSIILGIKPTRDLNFARYRNSPIYDVMREWTKWDMQDKISLDTLAKVLSFPSSKGGAIEGKDVAKAYKDGRIKEICEYCERDVELTRKIYKKMTFEI